MTVVPSGTQFEIVSGVHRATIVEVGGGIRTFTAAGHEVLDGYPVEEQCSGARGTPLIPWPNRIADGSYTFGDTEYQVAVTEPESHNAIHGFLRWRNWTAREHEADRVVMGTVLHPLMGYPFTLDVTVEYVLSDVGTAAEFGGSGCSVLDKAGRAPCGLSVTSTATNIGDRACPYATGQHPYLTVGTEFIDECELHLDATTWLPTDERGLPTGSAAVARSPYDFRAPRPIGDTHIDHAFSGLARDAHGLAWVRLRAPAGRETALWVDEHYPFVELYTGDTQPPGRRRRGLGVEPMTCAPNGFRSGNGLLKLDPGESITTRWGITPSG
ncbi:MAG: aldose 1-epimerase family protein [Pseudonocardiales bacterium]|nr:aldose 1-epimerase family protein [Pseudonocardiales bacterium]